MSVSKKYINFANIFLFNLISEVKKYIKINNYLINLKNY